MTTDSRLGELSALCAQMREAERAVSAAEADLKAREADLRRVSEEDIPGLMSELGLEKLTLDTGEVVSVGLEVYVGITKANRQAAYKWLEDNGHGALIATVVAVPFPREKRDAAAALYVTLGEQGFEPESAESVNAARLKSFIKDQLEAGAAVPLELFGARPVKTAKMKAARR